ASVRRCRSCPTAGRTTGSGGCRTAWRTRPTASRWAKRTLRSGCAASGRPAAGRDANRQAPGASGGEAVSKWQYTKGLHDLGRGCYSYLQPDGSWGWSNAGLIVDGEANLLVDTLFDLKLTREMLDTMRDAV